MATKLLIISTIADRTEKNLFINLKQKAKFSVTMLVDPKEPNINELSEAGLQVQTLHIKHRFDFKSALKIRKEIVQNSYDCIFATDNKGLACALFATLGIRCPVIAYRGTLGNLSYLDPSCWIAHLNPRLRTIVCNCDAVKNYLLKLGIKEKKLVTIYKGHRKEWYQGQERPQIPELNLPPEAFIIGCVANVRELKGIDVIIRALKELKPLPIHLLVVGKNDDPQYEQLAQSLDVQENVHFLGFRKDAVAVTRLFHLSIMASTRREGIPRSIVESMAQGIPAIVSDIGGLPELVKNGENGFVVPAKDHLALAKAIRKLFEDRNQLKQFGQSAISWIDTRFSAEQALTHYAELFNKLAQEKHDR